MAYNDNQELIEKLEERLKWYYGEATEEEFDADEVEAICTVLDKLRPIEEEPEDMDAVYEKLMARIREENADGEPEDNPFIGKEEELGKLRAWIKEEDTEEDAGNVRPFGRRKTAKPAKHRMRIRAAIIIGIGILGAGILSLNNYTKTSANKSLFTLIMEEVGSVYIEKVGEQPKESLDENGKTQETFDSWSDLDSEIKSKIMVPEYIPEGYTLYNIECSYLKNQVAVWADYYNKTGGHLFFEINIWENVEKPYIAKMVDEEGRELLSEYSDEDTLYYYWEEEKEYICVISMEDSYYKIVGNIELEEMIKIRDSLGAAR